jgi:hypothetical protein
LIERETHFMAMPAEGTGAEPMRRQAASRFRAVSS